MNRRIFQVLSAVVLVALLVSPAAAQTCGDPDGDGQTTVADGIQALRAAALLSSTCVNATCDLDGNGTINVADGVNVLRKSAGLSAPNACPGGGGVDAEVEKVVTGTIAPFLAFGFAGVADASIGAAEATIAGGDQVDCPLSGTRTKFQDGCCIIRVELDQCRYGAAALGNYGFDGRISANFAQLQVVFLFTVTEEASATTAQFSGFVTFAQSGGGFVINGGPITVTTSEGDIQLFADQLTFDSEGHPTSGGGRAEEPNDIFDLQRVTFTVTSSTTASVVATFDDNSQASFVLNLATGDFTPA